MRDMLIFVLITILFWAFSIGFIKFMMIAISEGQMFDILFGWQKMLDKFYASDSKFKQLAGKLLGECDVCFMHLMSIIVFAMYCVFCNKVGNVWITENVIGFTWNIVINIIWYLVFVIGCWYTSIKLNSRGV